MAVNTAILGVAAALAAPVKYCTRTNDICPQSRPQSQHRHRRHHRCLLERRHGHRLQHEPPTPPRRHCCGPRLHRLVVCPRRSPTTRDDSPLASPRKPSSTASSASAGSGCVAPSSSAYSPPTPLAALNFGASYGEDLGVFAVFGFSAGAFTCSRLSRGVLEIGVVPVGAALTSLFALLLGIGGFVERPGAAPRLHRRRRYRPRPRVAGGFLCTPSCRTARGPKITPRSPCVVTSSSSFFVLIAAEHLVDHQML